MTYYITVPSGLQDVAAAILTTSMAHSGAVVADRIISLFDGGVLFSSSRSPARIGDLDFIQNAFYVVRGVRDVRSTGVSLGTGSSPRSHRSDRRQSRRSTQRRGRDHHPPRSSMERLVELACSVSFDRSRVPREILAGRRSVRVVTSSGNRLVSVDRSIRRDLEGALARSLGLALQPAGADLELWIIERKEGSGIIGFRLNTRRATEADLEKGELRPELANLLCHLSGPSAEDCFLDPFCGSGAIVAERLRMGPLSSLFASDSSEALASRTEAKLRGVLGDRRRPSQRTPEISVRQADARDLSYLSDRSVSAVVTDPPWGLYRAPVDDLVELYRSFLGELVRVLSPRGRAVLLVGRDGPMANLLAARPELSAERSFDILVGGKKATVLTAQRSRGN